MKIFNKGSVIMIIFLIAIVCCTACGQGQKMKSNIQPDGIYILYKDQTTRVKYLTSNYEEVSDIKVAGGWDLCAVGQDKVYVTIPGDAYFLDNCVKVLKNGEVLKEIPLKYEMPMEMKYNPYNECVYVTHTYKLTYNEQNCISVIDTKTDKEIDVIMYDEMIEDITFSDNLMFVASTDGIEDENNLDVFDLKENKLVKHISVDKMLGSIVYSTKTKLIYGTQLSEREPIFYAIDWNKGEVVNEFKLNYDYPCELSLNDEDGKELIYISNVNIDSVNNGHVISVFDPNENKLIKEITTAEGIHDYIVDDNIYVAARYKYQAYIISKDNQLLKKIDVPFPMSITKAY